MRVKDKSLQKCYSKYQYNSSNKTFCILDDNDDIVTEVMSNIDLDDTHNPDNFEMRILYNDREDCSEDSIYQVCVDGQRIGWIFPIQAIHSSEHSYAENEYFLKYAYVAWDLLIRQLDVEINSVDEFDLFDVYDEQINLLVLDKENCKKINCFEFDKCIIGLYQKGYSVSGKGNLYSEISKADKKLHIKRQSKDLDDVPYIIELFKKQIPNETNAISRFYLYYQVIEILISKVFDNEFTMFVDDLQIATDKLFDKKEELGQLSNEKWRVRKLYNQYCTVDTYLKQSLNEKCIELLTHTNCRIYKNVEDNLYQVRCLMVHSMYMLDEKAENILCDIDDVFLDVIIQLVLTYHS